MFKSPISLMSAFTYKHSNAASLRRERGFDPVTPFTGHTRRVEHAQNSMWKSVMGLTVAATLLSPFISLSYSHSSEHMERYEAPDSSAESGRFSKTRRQRIIRLPEGLTPSQRETALKVMAEAEPRLRVLEDRLYAIMAELRSLSFSENTPQDVLITLGRELVETRDLLLLEAQNMNKRLEQEAGFNPGWGSARGCGVWRPRDPHHPAP